ncbi:bacteriocin fulvocin C-related protein [Capnocytophaga sputigena]|uniref:bacteriocin fulvocin C-related protein n=1 Tax=Capnocytophaga sputigena TaxID=1019 RepID=UPI0028D1A5ED|nr:bacteriocin fulvocin C-related protein [Capnocytophaga sputigena]
MKEKFLFLTVTFFCLFISCSKTQNNDNENNKSEVKDFRTEFIENKSSEEILNDFNQASFEVKQKLWIEKMNHLLKQDFNSDIKKNIKIIKDFIEDFGDKDKYQLFNEATIKLAESIPYEDFYLMFESLNDYNYSGNFIGKNKVSENFIDDIAKLKTSYYIGGYSDSDMTTAIPPMLTKRDCNCKWCLSELYMEPTKNCNETSWGCGFLFLQSCNSRG